MRSQPITPAQVLAMPGVPSVLYELDQPPYTTYKWDGTKMVEFGAVSGAGIASRQIAAPSVIFNPAQFANNLGAANMTWGAIDSAWGSFSAVKIVFCNPTASPVTVDNVIVAPSSSYTSPHTPTGAWSTPTGQITVPAGAPKNPSFVVTPNIQCRSVYRDDGVPFPLLYQRYFFAVGNTTYTTGCGSGSMSAANWDARSEGHVFKASNKSGGDYVTTPGGWATGGFDNAPYRMHAALIFQYDTSVTTVMGLGDSISGGVFGSTFYNTPYGYKSVTRLALAGKRVAWFNAGWSGQTMQEINTRGKTLIDTFLPAVIVIPSWTPNSAYATQADWDAQWYYFMDLAQYQISKGGKVLMMTPLVNDNLNVPQDGYRLNQRLRVLNSGLAYADVESAISNLATPARWITGLNFDAIHPNDAGHEAIAGPFMVGLSKLLA
jgi:lysophospholipase L1-like esterase